MIGPQLHKEEEEEVSKFGKYIVLCSLGDTPYCMLGPHYYVFICAFLTICFLLVFMFIKSMDNMPHTWKIIIFICILLTAGSYLLIGFSNPGVIPIVEPFTQNEQEGYQPRYCRFCKKIKPQKARHCDLCGICIRGHDHHCVWIGKCAGENNICLFYFFVTSVFITFILFFIAEICSEPVKSGYS